MPGACRSLESSAAKSRGYKRETGRDGQFVQFFKSVIPALAGIQIVNLIMHLTAY
jgi:hypothetical protein